MLSAWYVIAMKNVAAFSFALVLILSGCSESSSGDGGAGGRAGSGGNAGASGMGGTPPPPPAVDQTCRDICANEAEGFSCFQGPPDLVQACYEQCLRDYQAYVPCGDEWIAIYDCLLDLECADLFGECDSTQGQLDECVRLENNRIYCEAECPQLDIAECQQDISECLQFAQANRFCLANCAIQDRQECIAQYISTGRCGSGGAGGSGGVGGQPESRIFRTDTNQSANLGGIAGADAICAAQALTACLEGEFDDPTRVGGSPTTRRRPSPLISLEKRTDHMTARQPG